MEKDIEKQTEDLLAELAGLTKKHELTILAVDDVHANLFLLQSLLEDHYNMITVNSAELMWKHLRNDKIDLLLLDLMLPFENGFTILEKMKLNDSFARIPVIVISAKDSREDVLKAMSLGAKDYIVKPVKEDILFTKIAKILDSRS